jgi:hypothetical protein
MLASTQSVLRAAVEPIPAVVESPSDRSCLVRHWAAGSALRHNGITAAAARSGAQEADHHQ